MVWLQVRLAELSPIRLGDWTMSASCFSTLIPNQSFLLLKGSRDTWYTKLPVSSLHLCSCCLPLELLSTHQPMLQIKMVYWLAHIINTSSPEIGFFFQRGAAIHLKRPGRPGSSSVQQLRWSKNNIGASIEQQSNVIRILLNYLGSKDVTGNVAVQLSRCIVILIWVQHLDHCYLIFRALFYV